jgi:hypothetical protein
MDGVVEAASPANIKNDEILAQNGSIATHATNAPTSEILVWQLVFISAGLFFAGSDEVPEGEELQATRNTHQPFEAGWQGFEIRGKVLAR